MIRVFLLDDHEVVRRGLRELLEVEGIWRSWGSRAVLRRPLGASLPCARTS